MDGTLLLAGRAPLLALLGFIELYLHRRSLQRISIRIHVNGTRASPA